MPPQLVRFLNEVRTMSAGFSQTLIDADGFDVESSSGVLHLSRPGRFRWVYEEPYEQWLVADGLNVWSYDADLEQVTVKAQATALANTPALLLGGTDDVLAGFEYVGMLTEDGLTWVRLAPKDTDSGFRYVDLAFGEETLERMVFFDNLEQTTVVALSDVVVNGPLDAGLFEFQAPEGVDVVGTPAVPKEP